MKKSIKTLRNKADRLFQQLGRKLYSNCCMCHKEYSCLHHAVYKSQGNILRWDILNGVPVCDSCHKRIHSRNDPEDIWKMTRAMKNIHDRNLIDAYGLTWEEYIGINKREVFKANKGNLEIIIDQLQEGLESGHT